MALTAMVPLAPGFEEIEAISIIDILRRAGFEVTTAALEQPEVEGSHKIKVIADTILDQVRNRQFDLIVLPGGMPGTLHLRDSKPLIEMLKKATAADRYVAAICAAPTVLHAAGLLDRRTFTMHPAVRKDVPYLASTAPVEVDGKIITGQASGSAVKFALKIVETILGKATALNVNQGVLADLNKSH
jgi:4-methyl-5(b-hydroxyethyl)-thiazole monophosphate biosynthesis